MVITWNYYKIALFKYFLVLLKISQVIQNPLKNCTLMFPGIIEFKNQFHQQNKSNAITAQPKNLHKGVYILFKKKKIYLESNKCCVKLAYQWVENVF